MEFQHWITLVLGALGLAVQAGGLAVGFTWKLAVMKEALSADIIKYRDEIKEQIDSDRRIYGETLAGIRQKINDVELEAAKVYVRRESWHQAMNQLQETFGKSDQAAEQRMLRLEEKIDRLTERLVEQQHTTRGR